MRKPADTAVAGAAGRPMLRFARRNDLDGRYGWDWHVPGTIHESARVFRTRTMARLSAWWWFRSAARVAEVATVSPQPELEAA